MSASTDRRFYAPAGARVFEDEVWTGSESANEASDLGARIDGKSIVVPEAAMTAFAMWVGFRFEVARDSYEDYPEDYVRSERDALARLYVKVAELDPGFDASTLYSAKTIAGVVSYVDELEALLDGVEIDQREFPEPDAPIYLSGAVNATTRAAAASNPNLGILVQPGTKDYLADVGRYAWWALDNGCFSPATFSLDRWLRLVVEVAFDEALRSTCLFVTAPDVVGDAVATMERSRRILPIIRQLGLPAALVAQDGLEDLEVPWDDFDVLFIGGSTEWKLGDAAAKLADEARSRGKWVHVGRVNSWKRCSLSRLQHADSMDGTFLAYGPTTNGPRLEGWLARLREEAEAVTFVSSVGIVEPPSSFDYVPLSSLAGVA